MCCNTKISVYRAGDNRPFWSMKQKAAMRLVLEGRADFIEAKAIRLKSPAIVAKSSALIGAGNQGETYELSAIEKHCHIVQGGLTRNEHQPAQFSPCKGARVGH
jgi:hypothetical protein